MGRKRAKADGEGIDGPTDAAASSSSQVVPPPQMPMPSAQMPHQMLAAMSPLRPPQLQQHGMHMTPGMQPVLQPGMQMPAGLGNGCGAGSASDPEAAQRDLYEQQALLRYQQVAAMYEQEKFQTISPEVMELAEHFSLDDTITRALDDEIKRRKDTMDQFLQSLWLKLKDMRMGQYKGMSVLNDQVQNFAKMQKLDAQAAFKLGEAMEKREDPEGDMRKLGKHLERSNKPSSLMMMMLKDLRDGRPVKDPEYAAAVGSRVHEKELKKRSRSRRRSRDRGGRKRSRSRRR